jgi:hypothetical protein
MKELIAIQSELKAPKNQFNSFGKYKYRSQEDILEAVKPLLAKHECVLTLDDEVKTVGNFVFIEARATITNVNSQRITVTAQAGVQERKGMDLAQSFGASSSYARKYALNGLFLIDDTKDADATNTHGKDEETPTEAELKLLYDLANRIQDEEQRQKAYNSIKTCKDYGMYQKIQHRLEDLQPHIDQIPNPSQTDIKRHLQKSLA